MITTTEIEEPKPITEFTGIFIIYFKNREITMTHKEGGFEINNGVAFISRGRFERMPDHHYRFTVNGHLCKIGNDKIERVEIAG